LSSVVLVVDDVLVQTPSHGHTFCWLPMVHAAGEALLTALTMGSQQ
jgi:hypothetical protein